MAKDAVLLGVRFVVSIDPTGAKAMARALLSKHPGLDTKIRLWIYLGVILMTAGPAAADPNSQERFGGSSQRMRTDAPPARPADEGSRDAAPIVKNDYATVVNECVREWPGNWAMQMSCIQSQRDR